MASGMEELGRLQNIYRDLVNLNESRLPNIERLLAELEAHIEDFRKLLEKRGKNDKSRQALSAGSLEVDGTNYTINDDFKQEALQLAELLDLDEIEAARLYLRSVEDSQALDRSPLASAVILFHQRRQFILECLRLTIQLAAQSEQQEEIGSLLKQVLGLVLQTGEGITISGAAYWRKCLSGMGDIEKWLQSITERVQSITLTGQIPSAEFAEVMDFQRDSLTKQHESLGAVAYYLTKENHTNLDDFQLLLTRLKVMDRYDALLIHYVPVLVCSTMQFAPSINASSADEARTLQGMIITTKEPDSWSSRNLQAAAKVVWLAEYSARFLDDTGLPRSDVTDDTKGPEKRSATFMEALRDGAFHLLLSVCRDIKDDAWFDPLRHGITSFLVQDTPALITDPFKIEKYFQDILMLQLQNFVEAFITYMPDTLRNLKWEEDEQRKQIHGVAALRPAEHDLHLERFLILIAYAYEGFSESAESFWQDSEGNLFGFLQWASQRQSTPRIAAFCEMLRALSESEVCADYAHSFLLGEVTSTISSKSRRNSPLSWPHVFSEIEFYTSTIREKPVLPAGKPQIDLVEPESAMMLECYLRLLTHLSLRSPKARTWLITNTTFRVHEHLLLLCGSSTESRLRACAFSALAALLTDKDREVRDAMWSSLDAWISGGFSIPPNFARPHQSHSSSLINEQLIFESLSTGFEEPNSFVGLIQALINPISGDVGLNDSLPFPESLGAAYRMPGIEPYVDFVLGRVFAAKSAELQDPIQLRIMRWNCLNFAETCLSTFNVGLVMFANKSNVSVDGAIRTSSLATYARIHPFARVMEWFFNESVIAALFSAAEQNLKEVNEAPADSPLILSLIRSIQVIDLVLALQSTYFDIVRPIVKLQSANRRPTIANSALASFEDAVLNNITIVTSLGLYCGTGHEELAIASIGLLQRLSSSRKLSAPLTGVDRRLSQKSRLLIAMERNNEVESVSRSLIAEMRFDEGEFDQGAMSPGVIIKGVLLKFLNESLAAIPDRPTVAHLLLGFTCHPLSLDVAAEALFAKGDSLFHAIVKFMIDCPSAALGTLPLWLSSLRNQGMQLLSKLWKSPISAAWVLPDLRHGEFLFAQWLHQPVVTRDASWDGRTVQDPNFFISDSATTYSEFLEQRGVFFEYIATELKSAVAGGLTTLRDRLQSTSLGAMSFPDGQQLQCPTIFEFSDFLGFELGEHLALPESRYFSGIDFNACQIKPGTLAKYDLSSVEQLILLRQNELRQGGQQNSATDEKQLQADAINILQCFTTNNNRAQIILAYTAALQAWVKLILVFLECTDLEPAQRNAFILQGIQLVLPHLERSFGDNMTSAVILSELSRGLLERFDWSSSSQSANAARDPSNDRLFQLFRMGLVGIQYPDAPASLRQICYTLCNRYLCSVGAIPAPVASTKLALQTIKSLGERLTEIMCDDAYAGEGTCRIYALLLLGSIITTSNQLGSRNIINSMSRINFVQVMVDSIRSIPLDLATAGDPSELLSFYDASLALLLRISQTRSGAECVMSAGIFSSVRDSGLFNADPDIGLDVGNPRALTAYFKLLLAILRVFNAVVISRGAQNDQTVSHAHQFLQEHRMNIMAIFKRSAHIGLAGDASRINQENEGLIQDLVDNFTLLISASAFLATEQEHEQDSSKSRLFT